MKMNKYIWLAALPMLLSACQDDLQEGGLLQKEGIYTLSGKMSGEKALSRAQIQLGNTKSGAGEFFFWNTGDSFNLYQTVDDELQKNEFVISKDYVEPVDGPQTTATFSSATPAVPDVDYIAVYPANVTVNESDDVKFSFQTQLDFSNATTAEAKGEIWKSYFQNNMLMTATGQLTSDNNTISFEHRCALARVTYVNNSGKEQAVNGIRLGGDQSFGVACSFRLTGGSSGSTGTNCYELKTEGLTIADGESMDFYVLFLPEGFSDGEMHVTVMDKGHLALPTSEIAAANSGATGFEAGKRYWFKVTETENGMAWTKDLNGKNIVFKNKAFSKGLYTLFGDEQVSFDADSSAVMSREYVESLTELNFSWRDLTIPSMEGIEYFVNLETLNADATNIETCDLSKNSKLKYVNLAYNKLTSLDFSNNPKLENLRCSFNDSLTEINLTNCTLLNNVTVENTALNSLEIPNPEAVTVLYYGNTKVPVFDLAKFVNLEVLDVDNMGLENLDFIPTAIKKQLTTLFCDNNNLSVLDLSQFPMLSDLHCNHTNIEELNLKAVSKLTSLTCTENFISELDIRHLNMGSLDCGRQQNNIILTLTLNSNQKTEWDNNWGKSSQNTNVKAVVLDVEDAETVTIENREFAKALQGLLGSAFVTIDDNGYAVMSKEYVESVTELWFKNHSYSIPSLKGIEYFINLEVLECNYLGIAECDLSKNTQLQRVSVYGNVLTSLDLSKNTLIYDLNCSQNLSLSSLNISGCTNLKYLIVEDNKLTSIDIPNPEKIFQLAYSGTSLKFDFSKFESLRVLYCSRNGLTSIDLPAEIKNNLTVLNCNVNNLKSLDLTEYPMLHTLNCAENQFTTLDITPLSKLEDLLCGYQENDIVLKLTLTEAQKEKWDSKWGSLNMNKNVEPYTGPAVNEGNGNSGGSDFIIEGIY